jgi:hypothetical protein
MRVMVTAAAGMSGHTRDSGTAGHTATTGSDLGGQTARGRVQVPHPLPRALRALAHEAVVTEKRPHPTARVEPTVRPGYPASSSPAVPLACHSQQS